MELILFTEDFHRADLYAALGSPVATADWRGVVGWLRARTAPAGVILELSSARALDVLRALRGDAELAQHRVAGIALDPDTAATARRLGLDPVWSADEALAHGAEMLGRHFEISSFERRQ